MKTKLFTSLIALLFVLSASAQFHIGIKAGTNIGKVDGVSFKDQFRYGYHVGGFATINFSKKFALQPEVLFNQYSTTLDSNYHVIDNLFKNEQIKVKLNYMSIPILLNYKFIGPLYLQAGPQFAILMDQGRTILQNGGDAFKNGDFSLVGGVQFKLTKIYISGRYLWGLSNINDIGKNEWKTQTIQLSAGFAL